MGTYCAKTMIRPHCRCLSPVQHDGLDKLICPPADTPHQHCSIYLVGHAHGGDGQMGGWGGRKRTRRRRNNVN